MSLGKRWDSGKGLEIELTGGGRNRGTQLRMGTGEMERWGRAAKQGVCGGNTLHVHRRYSRCL